MKAFLEKIRNWIAEHKGTILAVLALYIVHLTIEGLAANLIYYKGLKPAYIALTA